MKTNYLNGNKVIVTGATSGIGIALSKMLCYEKYDVYGIGREFCGREDLDDLMKQYPDTFHPIKADFMDVETTVETVKEISKNHDIYMLINNAGTAYYGMHEHIKRSAISEMTRVNLEVPMILTGILLRDLKKNKGFVINISSISAVSKSPKGCAYAATKAGLTSFSHSLFVENRKYGLKVVNIQPDMTDTRLYRNADFKASEDLFASLKPEDVAESVRYVINSRDGVVIQDITLTPQLHQISKKSKGHSN